MIFPEKEGIKNYLLFLFRIYRMKKTIFITALLFSIPVGILMAQGVGINTTGAPANPAAGLDVDFNNKGFLPPRMTTAQRDAIVSPVDGLIVFNTTIGCPNYRQNGIWYDLCGTLPAGTITSLSCGSAINNGILISGLAASGVSSVVEYSGGNGGAHNGQTVSSTGVTGLTATLSAGSFALGNGTLTYSISGTPSAAGTASFVLNIGGQICTLTRVVNAGSISGLSCGSATNNGTLTASVVASNVSSVITYAGGNGGLHNGQTVSSTGVTGLTATLSPGAFAVGSGTVTYNITGTPSAAGTASFALNIGGQSCTLTRTVTSGATLNTFNYFLPGQQYLLRGSQYGTGLTDQQTANCFCQQAGYTSASSFQIAQLSTSNCYGYGPPCTYYPSWCGGTDNRWVITTVTCQ
jgi:hypothetical protein